MPIFLPKKIKVGFQDRSGTYTGKLAYVIYFDARGKLRKETSWNSWRDKKIDPIEYPNEPTEGFVLNKKVGGYSTGWNHRQTYCRVYDPRGFEFEITMENLLYVLENTSSIKGKGLDGEFVYGWDSGNLILIPASSPDYQELKEYSKALTKPKTFGVKNMIPGMTYLNNKKIRLVYLGRFDKFQDSNYEKTTRGSNLGKYYFFWHQFDKPNWLGEVGSVVTYKSLTRIIIDVIDENIASNYADLMDKLEHYEIFSPIAITETNYVPIVNIDEFEKLYKGSYNRQAYISVNTKNPRLVIIYDNSRTSYSTRKYTLGPYYNQNKFTLDEYNKLFNKRMTAEEIIDLGIARMNETVILENGKIKKG